MDNVTDQIKERVNVVDLVGEYLKLEKAGSNYKALCPFHNEKTPSFMVNPERNFWYCFGCQKGGDIFTFIQDLEGIDFREALERLAEKAGVEIPRYHKIDKKEKSRKKKVIEIIDFSVKFYQTQIEKSQMGGVIKDYLAKRKIDQSQLVNFKIGYAPDNWDSLLGTLTERGYSLEDIIQTGLLVHKEGQPVDQKKSYYDRFRDRIMFPVIDVVGNPVGFSARVRPGGDEKNAKYINTPQGLVYDKSQVLYGLYQAKTEIKKKDFVIIVEGNMDVVASFSAGQKNIVAVSGTALTNQQVSILKRYSENFKFCFDMDQAGQQATKKSIQTCLAQDVNVEIITLPEGVKDVNDLVIENIEKWGSVIEQASPVMDYLFQSTFNKYSKDNPKDKKMIAYELLNVIRSIADPIEKNYYLKKLSDNLRVEEEVLTQVLEKVKLKERTVEPTGAVEDKKANQVLGSTKSRNSVLQERLLGLFGLFWLELQSEVGKIEESLFDDKYREIWRALITGERGKFQNEMNECETAVKYSYDERTGFLENEIEPFKEYQLLVGEINKEKMRQSLKKIAWDVRKAEEDKDEEAMSLLMKEFERISRQIGEA